MRNDLLRYILAMIASCLPIRSNDVIPLSAAGTGKAGFELLGPDQSGVRFTNLLNERSAAANRTLETGSGVAAGDVDGDGWVDLFFCSLSGDSKLFRNLGNLHFRDITRESGIDCKGFVCRGATFVDVNGDSKPDLLVTASGRGLLFFRNLGNGRFTNETAAAGTANPFAAMSMTLADIDGNGSLDLYVTNYRTNDVRDTGRVDLQSVNGQIVVPPTLQNRFLLVEGKVQEYGEPDLLYLNDGHGHFTPASWVDGRFRTERGEKLKRAPLDWGLSAAFCDLNNDGLPDIYVCNDFWTPDRIWLNQGNGQFRPAPMISLRHSSASSMGVDFADIDLDGFTDFFVADMLATARSDRLVDAPSYTEPAAEPGESETRPQVNQNTLFHARADGTYEEIAEFSGLTASDWSWQPLFIDVDLDAWPDVLVASGFRHAVQDSDANELVEKTRPRWNPKEKMVTYNGKPTPYAEAFSAERERQLRLYRSYAGPLHAFRNKHDLRFEEKTREWGLSPDAVRHGIALADLDNDGDLDVVVNTLNSNCEVWINRGGAPRVAFEMKGLSPNTDAIGALVTFRCPGFPPQTARLVAGGHYLSSSHQRLAFAAAPGTAGEVLIKWPSGRTTTVRGIESNHLYRIFEPSSP